jgi:hypothetical protein
VWPGNERSGTAGIDLTGNGHTGTYTAGFTLGQTSLLATDPSTSVLYDASVSPVTVRPSPSRPSRRPERAGDELRAENVLSLCPGWSSCDAAGATAGLSQPKRYSLTEHLKVVDDQQSKRNRHGCAHHRESKPVRSVLAPHRITEAQELWAGPLNHDDPIGIFFVKVYKHSRTGIATASSSRA